MAAFDSHICMSFKIKTQFDILHVVYKQPVDTQVVRNKKILHQQKQPFADVFSNRCY